MLGNILTWPDSKICGALTALFEAKAFLHRTRDNVIMYDLGKRLKTNGSLTQRQLDFVRYKLPAYSKVLDTLEIKVSPAMENVTSELRFDMHNHLRFRIYMPQGSMMIEQVKRLTGVKMDFRGFYTCDATKRNGWVLRNSGFLMGDRARAFLAVPDTPPERANLKFLKRRPKKYQVLGVSQMLAKNGRVLLADDMGLGKSYQAIAYAEAAWLSKICIVCPASLKENWRIEIFKTTGDKNCYVVYGHARTKEALKGITSARWIIVNYDILDDWKPALAERHIQCYIFDEVQALKNSNTKRTKASYGLARKCPHVLALSGTPFENRPIELYPIMRMIDPAIFPSKIRYAERFCDLHLDYAGRQDMSGSSHTDELHQILSECCMIRRRKQDVLKELPSKSRVVIPVLLPNVAAKQYRDVEQDFITWLKGSGGSSKLTSGAIRAQALVKLNALKQVAAKGKLAMVEDWINSYLEVENKLVVFAVHHEVIDELKVKYADKAVVIDGRVASAKRQDICERFQNDPKIRLFIGNIKAAGTGLTLTAAKDTLTIELMWTSTAHDQAEDRVHRIGQTLPVTAYYMITQGTVEERIASLIDKKRGVITEIMDGEDKVDTSLLAELLKSYNAR